MPEARPARVHVITGVTCTGHPLFNRGPEEGSAEYPTGRPRGRKYGRTRNVTENTKLTKMSLRTRIAPGVGRPYGKERQLMETVGAGPVARR